MRIEHNNKIFTEFYKIKQTKNCKFYYTDKDNGYFVRIDGLKGQFGRLDNGKLFYQHTLATFTD